jgi:hypothetical protein
MKPSRADVTRATKVAAIAFIAAAWASGLSAAQPAPPPSAAATVLGATPDAAAQPKIEFAFEARVTLAPATVLGETGVGHRQYIPITGGTVVGPRFKAEVIPGGWDYQLRAGGGCNSLTADYFWKAEDGTVIHILNEGLMCPGAAQGERNWLRPRFEAPKGPHEWLTRATFVASLELERPATPPAPGTAPALGAIRIKFYQVK